MVGEEGKKTHVFHPGAAFNRGCGGCWSVQLLFGDERCTLKMHTMYVCCVCAGWRRQRCFIVPPPPPPPPRSASASPSQQVRGEYAGGKKKNPIFFFFPSTIYDGALLNIFPPPTPAPPSERWLHSIEASLLRCPQSRCRLKPRFPSTWELKIEGMIGSHLVISCSAGLTGRSLSCMCMTNEHNISTNTPRAV